MASEKGVKLHGMWASPFSLRVEWALKLKGVEYEYVSEDLPNKSPELLRYNPVHKKVPVLVHDSKPIAESLVIIEYIDEAWKDGYPIFPKDPYERAVARFWAKFAEDKLLPGVYALYSTVGDEHQKAAEDLRENLKIFEGALKGNRFFGGESVGYVDIVAGWIPYWLRMIQEYTGVALVKADSLPEISTWFHNILTDEVKQKLPPFDKLVEFNRKRREQILAAN